ncbi:MAG: radical SAM family heme chaperone HemW [Acidimicrobiales bacterium]
MTAADVESAFGVYLHVPFCAKRCDYCAFATWTDRGELVERYLRACRAEVERAVVAGMPEPTSLFVGGGTPSLVPAEQLLAVLDRVPRRPDAEVTIECNPDTVTPALLAAYRAGGVNRLSFGVQSMVPHVLAALGRTHDPANVRAAVVGARDSGFASFNLDVIYGAVGESLDDWRRTLDEVVALDPPHVSAYALTVEPGTPLAADEARHPDDDEQADKYILATEALGAAGYDWYEISNWAKPGHECRHNLLYWEQGDYLGFGCAAHSHRAGRRWWNLRTPERYLDAIESGTAAEGGAEELDKPTRDFERLELALRTTQGVPTEALPTKELGDLVVVDGGRAVLTLRGRLLASEVALRLRSAPDQTGGSTNTVPL